VRPGLLITEVGYIGGQNDHPTYPNTQVHAEGKNLPTTPEETNFRENFRLLSTAFIIQQQLTNR